MNPTLGRTLAVLLLATTALTACSTKPVDQQASGIETPSLWSRARGETASPRIRADLPLAVGDKAAIEQTWWTNFGDPTLNRLIQEALANNKTLQVAQARVEEARAGRAGSEAALLPEITGNASATRGNQGFATSDKTVNVSEATLRATWEVDLFGKNQARARESAAILQSEEARRQAVMVSLLAEVARNYFDLRNYEEQVAITQKNLATQQKTLDLITAQRAGALTSDLDVQRAAAQVSTTASQLPALRSAYEVTLNRLNVLLGTPPGTRDALIPAGQALRPLDRRVLVAAPATVLANRPDVRAAERRFAASISATDSAEREIFPTISLTAFFGVQDSTLFSTTPWGVGAGLVQPILNFGRIQSRIDAANARQKQAFGSYQESVLEALEDMENALSRYLHETDRQYDLNQAAEQNRRAVDLANQQYQAGYTGLLDLLVAQRNELEAESSLATSNAQLRKNLVSIYTAAGGGWDL